MNYDQSKACLLNAIFSERGPIQINDACQGFFDSKPAEGTIHIIQNLVRITERLGLVYSLQYFLKDDQFESFDKVNEACQEFIDSKPAEGTIHVRQN